MPRRFIGLPAAGGSGVTSITAGTGLTGGTITTTGTIALSTPVSTANGGTPVISVAATGGFFAPFGLIQLSQSGLTSTVTAGAVRAGMFYLPYTLTFTKATVNVTTTSNTNHEYIGVYSADKTTLLCQITFTLGAGTGALAGVLSPASVTLAPGFYWEAFSADNSTSVLQAVQAPNATTLAALNTQNVYWGLSNQTFSAGNMPAGLGTMSTNAATLPVVMLEP